MESNNFISPLIPCGESETKFDILNLKNPGVLMGKMPKDLFQKIKDECTIKFKDYESANHKLVGVMEEQLDFPFEKYPELQDYLIYMYQNWLDKFGLKNHYPFDGYPRIMDVWFNRQKKNEYNPIHNHEGTVSFVIWVKIPYDIKKELELDYYTNPIHSPKKAMFQFIYHTNSVGLMLHDLYLTKEDEGKIIMFPASLYHTVYPFTTSEDVRISIAGNIEVLR